MPPAGQIASASGSKGTVQARDGEERPSASNRKRKRAKDRAISRASSSDDEPDEDELPKRKRPATRGAHGEPSGGEHLCTSRGMYA